MGEAGVCTSLLYLPEVMREDPAHILVDCSRVTWGVLWLRYG